MSDEVANSAAPAASAEASDASANDNSENLEASQEETQESSDGEVQAAPDKKLSKAEEKKIEKQLKKLKLKIDGREIEEEFDPNDDEYLTKQLQKARAFEKRAQEYSNLEKTVRNFVEELRKDPRKVLSDPNLNVDLKKLAASIIEEEVANSQKSPEQLEKERLEAELKAMKEEREKEKEEAKRKEFERLQEQEYLRYETMVEKALEKSELPASPYVIGKIADYMLIGLQEKIDITPEDVIPLVKEEMQNDLKQMFAVMPDEVIEQFVGKDVFNRVRKKNLAKAKQAAQAAPVASAKAPDVGQSKATEDKKEKKTIKQLWGI